MAIIVGNTDVETSQVGAPVASLTATKPTGTLAGDLMLAYVFVEKGGAWGGVTAPAGWTEILNTDGGSANPIWMSIFYRIAETSDTTWNWTFADAKPGSVMTLSFRNVARWEGVNYRQANVSTMTAAHTYLADAGIYVSCGGTRRNRPMADILTWTPIAINADPTNDGFGVQVAYKSFSAGVKTPESWVADPSAIDDMAVFGVALYEFGGPGAEPADAVDPVITLVETPETPREAYVFEVYDVDPGIGEVLLWGEIEGWSGAFIVHDGNEFKAPYASRSTRTGAGTSGDPYVYTVYRDGGWPEGLEVTMYPFSVDSAGNIAGGA